MLEPLLDWAIALAAKVMQALEEKVNALPKLLFGRWADNPYVTDVLSLAIVFVLVLAGGYLWVGFLRLLVTVVNF